MVLKTDQDETILIKGAKGGGKGGGGSVRVAQESPDSLRSRAYARVVDLISEGEIEGLVTGDLQSVYLDRTPVQNPDGSFNFTGVTIATRNGTQNQSHVPGFDYVESEESVNLEVTKATPIVHAIVDTTVDTVRVTIGIPQLSSQNTQNGDITGTSVDISIFVQPDGGSYTEVKRDTISGKTTSRYQRSYLVKLTGTGPWNIKVQRNTADSTTVALQNKTYWDSLTEMTSVKLTYPNSAIAAAIIDSKQFANIPLRGYDVKLLRTKIPSNATVNADGSLSYTGSWDGTFQIAWHSNPAWVYYDMLTTARYGLGEDISEDQIDKWTLYSIGKYCDEIVPDGFGGFEPRFSCNIYFQVQAQAHKVMQDLASVFRGMVYWSSGLIVPTQDSPADPVALYSKANVIDGMFTRSGTSLDTRHSVALVTWNDPADFYTQKVEYIEDSAAIERYGIKQTQIVAVGCTSRGQANRVGRWLLYSESNDTELISFKCGIDSLYVRPGQVIAIQDADRAGIRLSGRVISATTGSITVDKEFTTESGATYTLMAMLPDGSVGTAEISSVVGAVLTLSTALSAAPVPGAIWVVTSTAIAVEKFRVVGISDLGGGIYEISALQYNELKYDAVENGIIITPNVTSLLNVPPDAPTGIEVSESLYEKTGGVGVLVTVAWNAPPRAVKYIFSYQRSDGSFISYDDVTAPIFEIQDAQEGAYNFKIVAVSATDKRSAIATKSYTVIGKTAPPADVQGLYITGISDGVANLTLTKSTDLDVLIGGFLRVRWSPETTGVTWNSAVDVGAALPGTTTNFTVPHVSGTFLAKFIDSSGNPSLNATAVSSDVAILLSSEQISLMMESPTFNGSIDYLTYNPTFNGIELSGSGFIDDEEDPIDDWLSIDYIGGMALIGNYDFQNYVDLGAVYPCQLRAILSARGYVLDDYIDLRIENIDEWNEIEGDESVDDTNAGLYVSTTFDDPAGSPTWSEFTPFFVSQVNARALRFRLILTSELSTHNIVVTECGVSIDIPDRTEQQNAITSGTSTYSVTFSNAFYSLPGVAITAYNMQSGDYFTRTNVTTEGFDISFFNSAGTPVSRVFDYVAKGQGLRS